MTLSASLKRSANAWPKDQAPKPSAASQEPVRTVRVELAVAGRTYPVTAPGDVADSLLSALEEAFRMQGGGDGHEF